MIKKIFVSGENGLLAKSIIELIANENKNKFEFVNNKLSAAFENIFHYFNSKRVKNKEVDITDNNIIEELTKILDDSSIIIHTAAYVNTDKCESFSYEAVKSNILGTQNLISVAQKTGCTLIHFSTTAVFDPDYYMLNNGVFDEMCKINPKTIYGLTKYCSELAVKQSLDKIKYIIIKPVFIYGDFPVDNSSMLIKIIKKHFDFKYLKNDKKLDVLLDKKIDKDYMYSEHFAKMFLKILLNLDLCLGEDFIISRNDPKPFGYYYNLIKNALGKNDLDLLINFIPEDDYLKRHNGISANFYKIFSEFKLPEIAFDDEFYINKLVSEMKNFYE